MLYRREIDGLRAFAVLPVIFFHAGFTLFSGGYVGVDVFFVISGFLITTIIIEERRNARFSLVNFYERRARRILPALFFVMLVSLPFAWSLLSPADLREFAQSLVAIALFGSNFLFWSQSGYFDTAAELKPMLHTWSLAVEEQYYLLFPLLIIGAWRFGTRRLVILIAAIAGASLLLSEIQVRTYPNAAFFLLPARAWQLLTGSMAAFLVVYWRGYPTLIRDNRIISEVLGAVGLLMILWATFRFNDLMPFPGFTAILPTLGTVLVLLFSSSSTLVGRLLGFAPLVGIGLISYSAYLWHQPIFAFTRHALAYEVPALTMLGLSALTLVLAYLSWRYIEKPFRARNAIDRTRIFAFSTVGIIAFIGLGVGGHFGSDALTQFRLRGFDSELRSTFVNREKLNAERSKLVESFQSVETADFSNDPRTKKVLILGDSVSDDLYSSMMAVKDRFDGIEIRRMWLNDPCMPYFAHLLATGELTTMSGGGCGDSLKRLRDGSLFKNADVIVLSAHWRERADDRPHLGAMSLAETIATQGKTVFMVGLLAMKDASSLAFDSIRRDMTAQEANVYAYSTLQHSRIDQPNADVRALSERVPNIHYLDKYALFCDDQERTCSLYGVDNKLLFSDTIHVSLAGAHYYGKGIADLGWFD